MMIMMTSLLPPSLNPHDAELEETTYHWNISTSTTNHSSSVHPAPPFLPCDNPRNVVSPFVAEMVDLVIFAGILPVIVICGVITNVINMMVFKRQGLSDRINLCLFSLAMSDTGFLLFLMACKSYALMSLVDPVASSYWVVAHRHYVLGGCVGFLITSNAITALISFERCLCIISPFKAAKFFKTKYTALVILVVAVYTLTVESTYLALKYHILQVYDPITNTSTFITRLSSFYLRHRTLLDIIYFYVHHVTFPFVSLVVVIVCTAAIIARLKVTSDWRRKSMSTMTSVEKQEVILTRMLVTVCCVYVVCMTPFVTQELLLFSRLPGFLSTGYLCNLFKVTVALMHILEAVNASINFHIYVRQSSRYRSTLRRLFHCMAKHQGKNEDCSVTNP